MQYCNKIVVIVNEEATFESANSVLYSGQCAYSHCDVELAVWTVH
jgi:hypothetical protein